MIAYRLRSGRVNRSGRETETDREPAGVVCSPGSEYKIRTTQIVHCLT